MSRRLRVGLCFYGDNRVGGPDSWLRRMAPRLAQLDIDPVAIRYASSGTTSPLSADLRAAGLPVREINAPLGGLASAVDQLLALCAQEDIEVLVADHLLPALLANHWGRAVALPSVLVMRSDDPFYWRLADHFLWGAAEWRVAAVVAVSQELTRQLQTRLPAAVQLLHCPSSVPPPPGRARWCRTPFHALYLGRLEGPQKRILETARALISVSRQRPWFSATLYGDGPLRLALLELLQRETGHQVRYGGVLPVAEVMTQLVAAQALVLLSAYEGLANSVQEAMACGVPVVARRTASGLEGVLIDGESALLIDTDAELGPAIDRLAAAPPLWQRLAQRAQAIAQERFAIDSAAQQWRQLLHALAPPPPAPTWPQPGEQEITAALIRHLEAAPTIALEEAWFLLHHARRWGPQLSHLLLDPQQPDTAALPLLHYAQRQRLLSAADYQQLRQQHPPAAQQRLRCLGAAADLIRGTERQQLLARGECGWETRRQLLYRAMEAGELTEREVTQLAQRLITDPTAPPLAEADEPRYERASLLKLATAWEAATALFAQLVERPTAARWHSGCHFHLGDIARQQGEPQRAAHHLRRCLQLCPDHRSAAAALAELTR